MLPKISGGFLNLTQKCNLKCKYCFVVQQPLEMDYKTAKAAVDFYAKNALENLDIPQVTFFGGEPMLKYDEIIKPLVEYIRSTYGDYEVYITSNGTLFTEENLEFLRKNNVGLLLSIDGDRETQNFNRPFHNDKGSFDSIDIDLILKYFPDVTMRSTLDRQNAKDIYKNYLFGESKGFKSQALVINSFADWKEEEYETVKVELKKITNHIKDCRENNKPYMEFEEYNKKKDDVALLRKINDDYFREEHQDLPACGTCGLGAGVHGSIGPTGNIYSCQEMTENKECNDFIIGNIYEGVDDNKRLELVKKFNTKRVACERKERCKSCRQNPICNGGCVINNYFKNNNLEIALEPWCRYEEMLLIESEELEVQNV